MKNIKIGILLLAMVFVILLCTGCTEASRVTKGIKENADSFNVARRIIVLNTRTDTVLYELIGTFSISNDSNSKELQVTSIVGENKYKLDYIYLADNITYIVQDVSDIYTDMYYYKFNILPSRVIEQ